MHYVIDVLTAAGAISLPTGLYLAHRKLKTARSVLGQIKASRGGYTANSTAVPTSQYTIPTERPHR